MHLKPGLLLSGQYRVPSQRHVYKSDLTMVHVTSCNTEERSREPTPIPGSCRKVRDQGQEEKNLALICNDALLGSAVSQLVYTSLASSKREVRLSWTRAALSKDRVSNSSFDACTSGGWNTLEGNSSEVEALGEAGTIQESRGGI